MSKYELHPRFTHWVETVHFYGPKHEGGNVDCPACKPTRCECGGLLHVESMGDAEDNVIVFVCDKCGREIPI